MGAADGGRLRGKVTGGGGRPAAVGGHGGEVAGGWAGAWWKLDACVDSLSLLGDSRFSRMKQEKSGFILNGGDGMATEIPSPPPVFFLKKNYFFFWRQKFRRLILFKKNKFNGDGISVAICQIWRRKILSVAISVV